MKRRRRRALLWLLPTVLLLAAAVFGLNRAIRPTLIGIARARTETAASRAMNEAIAETLASDEGGPLVRVHAESGRVYLLETDSARLNRLGADCALAAQEKIRAIGEQGIAVPLGTALNSTLLNGLGPMIRIRFTPTGSVQAACESGFAGAGINQTLHRITLRLCATVRIMLPGGAQTVTVTTEAPVSESVIVGDVPETFADVSEASDALNLIP